MSLTISQVLGTDTSTPELAGIAFDELARALDEQHDDLAAELREVERVWETGQAREAALVHGAVLRKRLGDVQAPLTAVAQALREFADGARAITTHLSQVVTEARGLGFTVADDGTVTAMAQNPQAASGYYHATAPEPYAAQIRDLLDRAAALDEATLRVLTANRPPNAAGEPSQAVVPKESIPKPGTDPAKVHQWWDSLTDAERRWLIANYPGEVGNLDGVPITARDQANRIVLDQQADLLADRRRQLDEQEADLRRQSRHTTSRAELVRIQQELDRIERERANIDGKLKGLNSIETRLADTDPGHPRAYLIGLSTTEQGKAIVSIGNPDEAANVLTYVPGTGTELSKVGSDMQRADWMADDANRKDPANQTAVIAWLGYDAPDEIPNAASGSYADRAVADLSRFQTGLRVTHEEPTPSHNVVLGHSYGTTVIGHTASQANINADDLIFVASPGVGVNNVTYLDGVPRDHIWATKADGDPIQWALNTRAHGPDPAQPGFGGQVFTSNPGGHSDYWSWGNPARENIALIVTGKGGVQLCPQPDDWRPWLASD